MGTTPVFAIPYVEPTDLLAQYPVADKAKADRLEALLSDAQSGKPYCEAVATTTQSLATSSETTVVFQSSTVSQAGMFTNGGSAITIPVAGTYMIAATYSFVANATGSRIAVLRIPGGNRSWAVAGQLVNAPFTGMVMAIRSLAAGGQISLGLYQSSGAALSTHSQSYPTLTVVRMGPAI